MWPTTEWRDEIFPDDPSNIAFRNNIVYEDRPYDVDSFEYATINIDPYIEDYEYDATAPSLHFGNNCYYNPNHALTFSFGASTSYGELGGFYTFSEWQALAWTDPDSGENIPLNYDLDSIEADPQFIAIDLDLQSYKPEGDSFRPAPDGPCAEMGAYAGLP